VNNINAFGVNQYLTRRLNISDTPVPAGSLAPEVFPVIDAKPPSIDDFYLRGERLCAFSGGVAAVAAQYGVLTLHNPANSGLIVTVDEFELSRFSGAWLYRTFVERFTLTALPIVASGVRDSRWGTGASRTAAIVRMGTTVTAYNPAWPRLSWPATDVAGYYRSPVDCVISPDHMWVLYTDDPNIDLFVAALRWRERPAQPSELG